MATYEVEYAKYIKVKFEAESDEEADYISSTMDDDTIEAEGVAGEYTIFEKPRKLD